MPLHINVITISNVNKRTFVYNLSALDRFAELLTFIEKQRKRRNKIFEIDKKICSESWINYKDTV